MKLLQLDSSPLGAHSVTRELTAAVVAQYRREQPDLSVSYRDLAADPLPHWTPLPREAVDALAPELRAEIERNEHLLREFLAADVIVVVSASLFGMLGPLSRFAYDAGMAPPAFVTWRAAIAFLALATYVGWRARRRATRLVAFRTLPPRARAAMLAAALAGTVLNLSMFIAFDRITIAPGTMNGQPCIRGLRLTVRRIVELIGEYRSREELRADYPELEDEDIRQATAYAAAMLGDERVDIKTAS